MASRKRYIHLDTLMNDDKATSSECPLFSLPLDIITLVLRYLTLKDIISLSLTSKLLRHLAYSTKNEAESFCSNLIHQKLLLPQTQATPIATPTSTDNNNNNTSNRKYKYKYKCLYCSQTLCIPSCSPTALYLDTYSGIFFPTYLYHPQTARYLGACTPEEWALSSDIRADDNGLGYAYSTVWCEHHRCPRDLLLPPDPKPKDGDSNSSDEDGRARREGANAFVTVYNNNHFWSNLREFACVPGSKFKYMHPPSHRPVRLAGYIPRMKRKHAPPLLQRFNLNLNLNIFKLSGSGGGSKNSRDRTQQGKKKRGEVVYERYCFETFCMHCLLPVQEDEKDTLRGLEQLDSRITRAGKAFVPGGIYKQLCTCSDNGRGCGRCGIATLKFTHLQPFISPGGLYIFTLATLCKTYSTFSSGYGRLSDAAEMAGSRRIEPIHRHAASDALRLVRGSVLVDPDPPRIGIQDLPREILFRILMYVLDGAKEGLEFIWMENLLVLGHASYAFFRAWHKDGAIGMTRIEWDWKEPWCEKGSGK
ncbi:hypothetical protein TWF694_002852 [Orbilia ellipsospora]|uniref:F-box domain-containing protein n=1 Tax=Orbilia ellipsospora TaxID=2528407 RepID=A0AAV9X151_9PEZI